jgi:hypothetical protein
MRLKLGSGGPPAGTYTATFVGVEETNHEQWGAGLKWSWEITKGQHKGKKACRTTGTSPTPKNACGAMLKAIAGRPLAAGEEIDVEGFVGETFMVIVGETDSGGTRVESAIRNTPDDDDVPFGN